VNGLASLFSATDRLQIASLCEEIFAGRYNEDLYREYGRWLPYITDIYLPICDSQSGDFRMLPFPGGILDQPAITMELLRLIQLNYRIVMRKQMER